MIFGPKLRPRGCVEHSVRQSGPDAVVYSSVISDQRDVTSVDTRLGHMTWTPGSRLITVGSPHAMCTRFESGTVWDVTPYAVDGPSWCGADHHPLLPRNEGPLGRYTGHVQANTSIQ